MTLGKCWRKLAETSTYTSILHCSPLLNCLWLSSRDQHFLRLYCDCDRRFWSVEIFGEQFHCWRYHSGFLAWSSQPPTRWSGSLKKHVIWWSLGRGPATDGSETLPSGANMGTKSLFGIDFFGLQRDRRRFSFFEAGWT